MDLKLESTIFKKFPKIFKQRKLPMTQTCMCWGLECSDGWYNLIVLLCKHLQFMTDRNKYPQVEAIQVKEKFGTLRFYHTFADSKKKYPAEKYEYMRGMIDFAEYLSGSICEQCGSMDNVSQTEGWIITLCGKCMKERNEKE